MEARISEYIKHNKVFTLATCIDNVPYAANCFYCFEEETNRLIFMSNKETRHIKESIDNLSVAGTINNGVTTVAKIQGIQFTGKLIVPNGKQKNHFNKTYLIKFPFAITKLSPIWGIQLEWIKMTDNTLGFGNKLIWKRKI